VVSVPAKRPHPAVFGYHEVWHTFLIGATACHLTLVLLLIHP
jgi:predicted membrane channel-forming protein YqfA (hemolysin III family)